jgi:hypothetical protein
MKAQQIYDDIIGSYSVMTNESARSFEDELWIRVAPDKELAISVMDICIERSTQSNPA